MEKPSRRPRNSLDRSGWATPSTAAAARCESFLPETSCRMAWTRSAFASSSSAPGSPRSANTLPLLGVTVFSPPLWVRPRFVRLITVVSRLKQTRIVFGSEAKALPHQFDVVRRRCDATFRFLLKHVQYVHGFLELDRVYGAVR